jgi:predicted metal-dependent peptidase
MINDSLSKVSKQLIIDEPFYGLFLLTLNKTISETIPTAGVSKNKINCQLTINPKFWNSLENDNKRKGLLKHELLHICFNHLILRTDYHDKKLFNIAADIEINQYISPDCYPTDDILLPSTFPELNLPLKAGTREYYELLQQAKNNNSSSLLIEMLSGGDDDGDMHSTWDEFDKLSEADKRLVKSQVEHQLKEIADSIQKGRGFIPGELSEYINSLYEKAPASFDWKAYVRRFTGMSHKVYTKKTRRKLNKRFEENPALKIKTKTHILVGVDTSGSISQDDLIEFFNEITHIHKTGVVITIAECDAVIHKTYPFNGKVPEQISGRGGTDMNPLIELLNKGKYTSLITLTDGFIGGKTVITRKPTLTVVCSGGENIESLKEWGNVIKIQR